MISVKSRYIFSEMAPPFVINLIFFTFIFLMAKILEITNLIVNFSLDIKAVLLMLLYAAPFFFVFVVPMSVMVAVLLAFMRLSGDNEIIAFKAGGLGLHQLLNPVIVFVVIGFSITFVTAVYGLRWGRISSNKKLTEIASENFSAGLTAGSFIDTFSGVVLYINKVDPRRNEIFDIFIEDKRDNELKSMINAPRGKIFSKAGQPIFHIRLFNGTVSQVNLKNKTSNSINFNTYDVRLDLAKKISNTKWKSKNEKLMTVTELNALLKQIDSTNPLFFKAAVELHRKFSIPFSCIVLGLLAMPLGARQSSSKRSYALGLGVAFFLLYYIILSTALVFAEKGLYHPAIALWIPNVLMGGIAVFLFLKK